MLAVMGQQNGEGVCFDVTFWGFFKTVLFYFENLVVLV